MDTETQAGTETAEAAPETTPETGATETQEPSKPLGEQKQPAKPLGQEAVDYKKDKRWGKMWKSENDVYKSFREVEKWKAEQHDPLKKQYDSIVKTLEAEGYSPDKIQDVLSEVKKWKDPENPIVVAGSYLQRWLQNPAYRDSLVSYLEDLETKELQRQYPGYTREQIEKVQAQDQKINELNTWKQEQERTKLVSDYGKTIDGSMDKIKQLAKTRDFAFTPDMEIAFYEHCNKNGIPPMYMLHEFRNLYDEALDKSHNEQIQKKTLETVRKNKSATILDGKPAGTSTPGPEGDFRTTIRSAIRKMGLFQ